MKLAALLVGLLAVVLAAEGGARLVLNPPVIKGNQISDARFGFRHQGNRHLPCYDERGTFDYRLNSEGFRGPELPEKPPATEGRAVILGDSFINAWGVREEDWVGTRMVDELAAAGRQSSVHALCADDIGTGQELLFLDEFAPRVQPTEVVLFLFPGNDVINNSIELAGRSQVSPGDYFRPYLERDAAGHFTRRYALPARARLRHSRIFALLEARLLSKRSQDELLGELYPARMNQRERIKAGLPPSEYMEVFRAPPPGDPWESGWGRTEDLLRGFAERTKQLGARLLVVVIPTRIQVEHSGYSEGIDQYQSASGGGELEEMLDLDYPEARLEGFFHAEAIDHVLLLEEFRRQSVALGSSLYIQNGHLNGLAHRLMGALVARWILHSEPGLCFQPAPESEPVAIESILPPRPTEFDFQRDARPEILDSGWDPWERPFADFAGGWPLRQFGTLFVPNESAEVTLAGYLAPDGPYPVELVLTAVQKPRRTLARQSFDAAGPFALSFSTEMSSAEPNAKWFLAKLSIESELEPTKSRPRLRLRSLRTDPE